MRPLLACAGLLMLQGAALAMTCAGGDTMQALAQRWASDYGQVSIQTGTKLSAEGFDLLLDGKIDCVTFVREPFPAEMKAYREKFAGPPLLIAVGGGSYATKSATHAIAIYVNADNPLSRLTMAQLEAVFSGRIKRWSALGWVDQPIHFYSMLRSRSSGNPPGIVNYLQGRVLRGAPLRDDVIEQSDRPGESALDAIVHRVAEDRFGIGFSGFANIVPGVKSLALAESEDGPYFAGTSDEVARRLYPLSRKIYLMVRPDGAKLSSLQRGFLQFVLSDAGQRAFAEDKMGFLPLTEAERAAAQAELDRF